MTYDQKPHIARGIIRIRQAVESCDFTETTTRGTIYTVRFTKLYIKLQYAMMECYKEYKLAKSNATCN